MKHFWRKLLLLVLLMLPWQAGANQPDVLDAAKSVYRLWIGVPLPAQTASQLVSPQMLSEINDKGYVRIALVDEIEKCVEAAQRMVACYQA